MCIYIRNCNVIEPGYYCAHGNVLAVPLLEEELGMFIEESITLPESNSINQYKSLHLINKNRIIKTQLSSKAILRDNSGVVYLTTGGTIGFGQLQKFVVFEINRTRTAFAVISCLEATTEQLCKDSVTAAKLNDHIVSLKIPRYRYTNEIISYYTLHFSEMKKCVIPVTSIKDKCILLSHSAKSGVIYASLFPNSAEPEWSTDSYS